MGHSKTMIGLLCVFVLSVTGSLAAVRGDQAMYVGGTITAIREKTEGKLVTSGDTVATFTAKKGSFTIPYQKISSLEYGQKAGRRIGVAVAVNPLFLLSKKRKHYLTVGFVDENGNKQGAVFEIGKGKVRSVTTVLETRSGKKIEFESDDAKKHFGGK